jgi:hypothetical protein
MFRDDTVLAAIFVGAIGLLVVGVWALVVDVRDWEAFKASHECRIVGKMHGEMINTFDTKGNIGIGFTSGKTGWSCNDGVTYWR